MPSKKHHYIPKCYLKAWTGADGLLCEYRRPFKDIAHKRRHPSETGWLDKLYSVDTLPADQNDLIETVFFARVDQSAADVLAKFLKGETELTQDQRSGWSRFLMSLLHRHPAQIKRLWKMSGEKYQAEMADLKDVYEEKKGLNDPATFEEFVETMGPSAVGELFSGLVKKICDSPRIGAHLNNMHAHIFELSGTHRFVTSDRPLLRTNGLGHEATALLMPISPRHLFVSTNEIATLEAIEKGLNQGNLVADINEWVVRQAYRSAYALCENSLQVMEQNLCSNQPLPWGDPLGNMETDL